MRDALSQEQRTSSLVPLPKKGDLGNTGNWRGISLMQHITKLFDAMLLQRARQALDHLLHPAQNGFRPGRSTAHHIAALLMLEDLATTHRFPLHGCFVDFSKAFDSVTWDAIYEIVALESATGLHTMCV
eukprot:PhM_4_TR3375/c0_g1_i1/m.90649